MATGVKPADRRLLYFYGVTQSRPAKAFQQTGVDLQSPVESIDCEGLVCWVSQVSAKEFGTALTKNMENLEWLTTASIAHQRAVQAISQAVDMLPARLGTVFRDEHSLAAHIRGHVKQMSKDFERVKDSEEWGVKIFETAPPVTTIPKVRSGKEYLMAKAALLPRTKAAQIPEDEVAEFQSALAEVAEESAPAGRIGSGQRGLAFQTSLLVKRHNRQRLQTVLRRFTQKWAETRRVECSGPWPPYSFISQDSESR